VLQILGRWRRVYHTTALHAPRHFLTMKGIACICVAIIERLQEEKLREGEGTEKAEYMIHSLDVYVPKL
jgi:hypothetical protein